MVFSHGFHTSNTCGCLQDKWAPLTAAYILLELFGAAGTQGGAFDMHLDVWKNIISVYFNWPSLFEYFQGCFSDSGEMTRLNTSTSFRLINICII